MPTMPDLAHLIADSPGGVPADAYNGPESCRWGNGESVRLGDRSLT